VKRQFAYNPQTCRYEPVFLTGKKLIKRVVLFFASSLVAASGLFVWYINRYAPIQEQYLQQRNYELKVRWASLEERIDQAYATLGELVSQDDENYRVILDLQPLGQAVREAGVGGAVPLYLAEVKDYDLILETYRRFEKLKHQVDVEQQSYEQLNQEADNKRTMWASRPAIQPIHNKELTRLHTTFGLRMHPIFNMLMDHKGLDFTAAKGTPVYATGDGRISMAYFSGSYGNVIYLDHGFDFETRYAHLYKFIVRQGQFVKRGELIGYVGNTGISASPHLHYEVLYKGSQINPINFFQRDLNHEEYEKLITLTADHKRSLD
jgi:murein DD-endopeptidase MepM/ murein hydrolase activator NlpD